MELLTKLTVKIRMDTNKTDDERILELGEYNDEETKDEFIERVSNKIKDMLNW
jgi:hypothetical protein